MAAQTFLNSSLRNKNFYVSNNCFYTLVNSGMFRTALKTNPINAQEGRFNRHITFSQYTYAKKAFGKFSAILGLSPCCSRNILRQFSTRASLHHTNSNACWFQQIHGIVSKKPFTSNRVVSRLFGNSSALNQNWKSSGDNNRKNNDEKKPDDDKTSVGNRVILIGLTIFSLFMLRKLVSNDEEYSAFKMVSWNEFVHDMLAKGEVAEIIVRPEGEIAFVRLQQGAIIKGHRAESDVVAIKIESDKLEEKLRKAEDELGIKMDNRIPVTYQRVNAWMYLLFTCIVLAMGFFILKNVVKIQLPNPTDMFSSERKAKFVRVDLQTLEGKGVSFKDIAGLHEAKVEIMEFVDYLTKPQKFQELGAHIPCGALLLGPPGCGKTLLAKAVASEAKVPFLAMAGSDFVEMLGGLGAARVRDLFKEARQHAPCIIYIDEVDAVGRRRAGGNMSEGTSEDEHTLNQLLVEMDGMSTTPGVIVIASTNRADILDKALLRPGRFDRHIMIDLPTMVERKEIFEVYLKKLRLVQSPSTYSGFLAQLSPGMSGADIANICNEAALHAAREKRTAVDHIDFDFAVDRVLAGVAKKSRVLSVQEKKVVAYHEAGHAVVSWLLENTETLLKVSIVPRIGENISFSQYLPSDQKLISKEELFERMCVALGGRVAETLIFNSSTSSAQDDLKKVTRIAYNQIKLLGMNERIGHLSFPVDSGAAGDFGSKPYSKKLQTMIDEEANLLITKAFIRTEALLRQNKAKLRVVAEALLEKETLSYRDMEELIGPPPFGKKTITGNEQTIVRPPPAQSVPV